MGGDGKHNTLGDCPVGSKGAAEFNRSAGGAIIGDQFSPIDVLEFVLTAGISGETSFTKYGRDIHKVWDYGAGFEREFRLPSGKRADAVNFAAGIVKEFKPNNPNAIRRGLTQVSAYARELSAEMHRKFTGIVETYNRDP